MAAAPIDFFFDFSSPYAYIAMHQIEALAARHGREVAWHPMLLGAIFKITGGAPLTTIPLKDEYSMRDFARSARLAGVGFKLPEAFPINTVNAARAALWVKQNAPQRTADFIRATGAAYFMQGRPINDPDVLQEIASGLGLDGMALADGIQNPEIKEALKRSIEHAIERKVFGAPFIFVDNEPFWGQDRLAQVDQWLAQGGF